MTKPLHLQSSSSLSFCRFGDQSDSPVHRAEEAKTVSMVSCHASLVHLVSSDGPADNETVCRHPQQPQQQPQHTQAPRHMTQQPFGEGLSERIGGSGGSGTSGRSDDETSEVWCRNTQTTLTTQRGEASGVRRLRPRTKMTTRATAILTMALAAAATVATVATLATTGTVVEAFAPPVHFTFERQSAQSAQSQSEHSAYSVYPAHSAHSPHSASCLYVVRKRSGNHDLSSGSASYAAIAANNAHIIHDVSPPPPPPPAAANGVGGKRKPTAKAAPKSKEGKTASKTSPKIAPKTKVSAKKEEKELSKTTRLKKKITSASRRATAKAPTENAKENTKENDFNNEESSKKLKPIKQLKLTKETYQNSQHTKQSHQSHTQHSQHSRLTALLLNDDGEQDLEPYKDDSPEAANQLADFKSYSKMNEEAKRKAKGAVSHSDVDIDDNHADEYVENDELEHKILNGQAQFEQELYHKKMELDRTLKVQKVQNLQNKQTLRNGRNGRKVRATVKETGSDSISTYIKSLGQHELLFKEDEVLLGRQVRILSGLEEERMGLERELMRPPTFHQWATATNHTVPTLKQQIRRSQRAKAALIEANLRLVIQIARRAVKSSRSANLHSRTSHSPSSIQFQDACQQGIIGLTRATEKFDPELGFRFSTYATWWIQKEVAKNVSEQSRSVRLPQTAMRKINDIRIQERVLMTVLGRRPTDEEVAQKCGMTVEKLNFYRQSAKEVSSLDKKIDARTGKGSSSTGENGSGNTMEVFVQDTEHPSPEQMANEEMMKADIRRLVKTLSPREQAVIRLRFGLDDGKPMGLGDIGERFGVEKERIKKIEARALLKLRQPSRSQVVKCYVSDHT